ncbi:MAG TPA: hypothetical protein HA360_00005 [Nanoarchaeota archaeon]|nr:hypothetical protein [Nanoarchaeota archaeon]
MEIEILGKTVSYDSSLEYMNIDRTLPPERRERDAPLLKTIDPRNLEALARGFEEQERPQMFGEVIQREWLCLYSDVKEGKISYVDARRDEEIGKMVDLLPAQRTALGNTLSLYKFVLEAIGQTEEMYNLEMCYGDRPKPEGY